MGVLFLHIPKTAGQSVHEFLIDRFEIDNVCPARDNDTLRSLDMESLHKYKVYSGHFDWNLFDQIDNLEFTFSILRDPVDRILSYYFYLREQATIFEERGQLDDKPGLKASLYNTPQEFFVAKENPHRDFLDQLFDNFYTYFFAGRQYSARNKFLPITGAGNLFADKSFIVDLAVTNINSRLDAVYWITEWRQSLARDLNERSLGVEETNPDASYNVNVGGTSQSSRLELLCELGADQAVLNRIHEMCVFDYQLLQKLGLSPINGYDFDEPELKRAAKS